MKNQEPKKPLLKRNTNLLMHSEHRKKRYGILKIISLIVIMALFVFGAYASRLYSQVSKTVDNVYKPVSKEASKNIAQKKPVTILLLGVDTGGEGRKDRGNSDTMIVATVNPDKKKTMLVSVPRDTLAEIHGIKEDKRVIQKVNSAYNLGAAPAAVATVQDLLNIKINNYITLDFHSLPKIVDAVGGIEVDSPFAFSYDSCNFKKGKQVIDGRESLAYARMRYDDPDGDYGRQKRQRQVIFSIIKKSLSLNTLPNVNTVLQSISTSMSTDLSMNDMTSLIQYYRGAAQNMSSDYLQGYGSMIDGVSYEIAPTKELQRVSNKLRTSVGLKKKKLNNEETKQNQLNVTRNNFDFENKEDQNYIIYGDNISSDYIIKN